MWELKHRLIKKKKEKKRRESNRNSVMIMIGE